MCYNHNCKNKVKKQMQTMRQKGVKTTEVYRATSGMEKVKWKEFSLIMPALGNQAMQLGTAEEMLQAA